MRQGNPNGRDPPPLPEAPEAHAYTDGASIGSQGPGGYGAVLWWEGKTQEISGSERETTNQRMELTAACVALETIGEGHVVTVYSDSSYLINCMRRGWHEKWRENGWLNRLRRPVANRDLWERLLEASQRHREVRWKKVKGHSQTEGPHKVGTTGPTSWPWLPSSPWPPGGRPRVSQLPVIAPRSGRPRASPGRHAATKETEQ